MSPEENKVQIAINRTSISGLKETSEKIYTQVSNHIPTAIKALDDRMDKMEVKIGQMWIQIGVVVSLITFLAQKFIK